MSLYLFYDAQQTPFYHFLIYTRYGKKTRQFAKICTTESDALVYSVCNAFLSFKRSYKHNDLTVFIF